MRTCPAAALATSGNARSSYGRQEQPDKSAIPVAPRASTTAVPTRATGGVTFADGTIRRVGDGLCANAAQRLATGFGRVGGMGHTLARGRTNAFRAVAVISGGEVSGCDGGVRAALAREVAVQEVHDDLAGVALVVRGALPRCEGLDGAESRRSPVGDPATCHNARR